jgi:hypothetical protein
MRVDPAPLGATQGENDAWLVATAESLDPTSSGRSTSL